MEYKNDELDRLISQLYPCHKKHKDHLFFQYDKDYYNCPANSNHNEKCEDLARKIS